MLVEGTPIDRTADIFALHAQFCKVFSNPVRLRVMWELAEQERTVTELAEIIGVTLANLSQHLRMMRDLGVVTTRRQGQNLYYSATSPHFHAGCTLIRQGIQEVLLRHPALGTDKPPETVDETED
jgi:ArsR family transcriptional regulator, virulence genes transcriptional regulator